MEEVGRGRWKKFTAVTGRSSPRWGEEVDRGTHSPSEMRQKAIFMRQDLRQDFDKPRPAILLELEFRNLLMLLGSSHTISRVCR